MHVNSAGGLIALGLGFKRWRVTDCKTKFTTLSKRAFTKRFGVDVPFVGQLIQAVSHSKYVTEELEAALMDTYGGTPIFGAPQKSESRGVLNVGLVSTSSSGKACFHATYNRPASEKGELRCNFYSLHFTYTLDRNPI